MSILTTEQNNFAQYLANLYHSKILLVDGRQELPKFLELWLFR